MEVLDDRFCPAESMFVYGPSSVNLLIEPTEFYNILGPFETHGNESGQLGFVWHCVFAGQMVAIERSAIGAATITPSTSSQPGWEPPTRIDQPESSRGKILQTGASSRIESAGN